jgi:hypothetical protein
VVASGDPSTPVVCWAFAAGNEIAPRSKLNDNIVETLFIARLSFIASKTDDVSLLSSQEPGQDTQEGGPMKTARNINGVTKLGASGGRSAHPTLSEISERLRKFGDRVELFCVNRSANAMQPATAAPELDSVLPIV